MPKKIKRKVGRPKIQDRKFILALIPKLQSWCDKEKNFWLGDFATDNGFWRQRLEEFADQVPEFAVALKRARSIQESRLMKMGMDRNYNGVMAIFALKNVAGWRDIQPGEIPSQYFNITIGTNGQTKGDHVQIGKHNGQRPAVN